MREVSLSGHASAVRRQIGLPTSKVNLGTIVRVGVLACAALITSTSPAMGQAGKLDPTFATGGVFTSTAGEFNNMGTFGNVVAIQGDGKIVVGGQIGSVSGVLRLNANGTHDSTFGTGGIVSINFPGTNNGPSQVIGVGIQTDGKILAGISNANQDLSPIFIRRGIADGKALEEMAEYVQEYNRATEKAVNKVYVKFAFTLVPIAIAALAGPLAPAVGARGNRQLNSLLGLRPKAGG